MKPKAASSVKTQRHSIQDQLSQLRNLLYDKQETCSEAIQTIERQRSDRATRRERKERETEELRQRLRQMISEQEEQRNKHVEDSAQGKVPSIHPARRLTLLADDIYSVLRPMLQEIHREKMAGIMAFAQGTDMFMLICSTTEILLSIRM